MADSKQIASDEEQTTPPIDPAYRIIPARRNISAAPQPRRTDDDLL